MSNYSGSILAEDIQILREKMRVAKRAALGIFGAMFLFVALVAVNKNAISEDHLLPQHEKEQAPSFTSHITTKDTGARYTPLSPTYKETLRIADEPFHVMNVTWKTCILLLFPFFAFFVIRWMMLDHLIRINKGNTSC